MKRNDGWIDWGGGECPVPVGMLVDVKWRDGRIDDGLPAGVRHLLGGEKRHALDWENHGSSHDIIAYRPHKSNECNGQDVAPVWSGEGKPTIGTKCEHHSGDQWEIVTIAGIYANLVTGFTDYWMVKEDGCSYTVGNPYRFRPIRTEEERAIDEMVRLSGVTVGAAKILYDAGYRKTAP